VQALDEDLDSVGPAHPQSRTGPGTDATLRRRQPFSLGTVGPPAPGQAARRGGSLHDRPIPGSGLLISRPRRVR
jgi:hypothetical protein